MGKSGCDQRYIDAQKADLSEAEFECVKNRICDAFNQPAYKFLHGFKGVVQLKLLWKLHWQERKNFDFFFFHCVPPNKNRTIHADCPAKVKGEHPKTLSLSVYMF